MSACLSLKNPALASNVCADIDQVDSGYKIAAKYTARISNNVLPYPRGNTR